jgi:hypothetical protein
MSKRKRILIFLVQSNKKYIADFDTEKQLLELNDLVTDINGKQLIDNGNIKNPEEILERWEVKSAKIKNISKNKNQVKATIEVDCKLLLRKTD